jgi:hypothetical protein
MSRNTLSSSLSFCCASIVLFCPGAPKPWLLLSYQWTILTVNFPECFTCKLSFCQKLLWQKCWGSRQRAHFFSTCELFLTLCHTRQSSTWSTPIHCNQGRSVVCACVQFQHYSLQLVLIYKIFWKSRVLLNFFCVVYLPAVCVYTTHPGTRSRSTRL